MSDTGNSAASKTSITEKAIIFFIFNFLLKIFKIKLIYFLSTGINHINKNSIKTINKN